MKNWIVLLTLASFFLLGCQKEGLIENPASLDRAAAPAQNEAMIGNIGVAFTLKLNETIMIKPDGFYITFTGVQEDSRCPSSATCVWEGRAMVELMLENRDDFQKISLQTPNSLNENGDMANPYGRTLQLLNVGPYPDGLTPIPPDAYRVTLVVNKQVDIGDNL